MMETKHFILHDETLLGLVPVPQLCAVIDKLRVVFLTEKKRLGIILVRFPVL